MGIDLVAPYSFIPTYKGLQDINKKEGIKTKKVEVQKKERIPMWTRLLMDARTFFEHPSIASPAPDKCVRVCFIMPQPANTDFSVVPSSK